VVFSPDSNLSIVHPEHFDKSIIGPRHNERQSGVETGPVDASVVAFQDVLHNGVGLPEQVRGVGVPQVLLQAPRSWGHVFLAET